MSVLTERKHWINARGSPRGHPTGDCRSGEEHQGRRCKRRRIGWLNFKEEFRQEVRERQRDYKADHDSCDRQPQTLSQDHR